jgi:hypothetical protein
MLKPSWNILPFSAFKSILMSLHWVDLLIVLGYLIGVAIMGFLIRKKASAGLDSYFLAGRNLPWWGTGNRRLFELYRYRRDHGIGGSPVLPRAKKPFG